MNKQSNDTFLRAKKMLSIENGLPNDLIAILRSDVINILDSYFDFNHNSFNLTIEAAGSVGYNLAIDINIDRVKPIKIL